MRKIANRLTTLVTVVSLTLTSMAGPLQAQDRDGEVAGQILGGLIGLALLGAVISEIDKAAEKDRKEEERRKRAERERREQAQREAEARRERHRPDERQSRDHRPSQAHLLPAQLLPAQCRLQVNAAETRFAFGDRCLRRNAVEVQHLPRYCRFEIGTQERRRRVWSANCLRREGFRMQRS